MNVLRWRRVLEGGKVEGTKEKKAMVVKVIKWQEGRNDKKTKVRSSKGFRGLESRKLQNKKKRKWKWKWKWRYGRTGKRKV